MATHPDSSLYFSKPVPDVRQHVGGAGAGLTVFNWELMLSVPSGGWSYAFCIEQRDKALAAIDRLLSSGVKSYRIGSRGLERLEFKDLTDWLKFWRNQANDAALGVSSAIQSRRAIPCDV